MTRPSRQRLALIVGIVATLLALVAFEAHDRPVANAPAGSAPTAGSTAGSTADRIELASGSSGRSMIRVEVVKQAPLPLSEVLSARVVYDEDRTARVTTSFAGRITRLIASPGDPVRPGSPLAEIDSPDFALAASDLAKAHADEERKRATLTRSRDLLSGGVIPQKDVESADADFAQARAETTRAAQRVRNINPTGATLKGGSFLLTSPTTGVVTERNANPAMEVNPSLVLPLFVISDLSRLWVQIDVPERLLGQIDRGMHVSIESDAFPGEVFVATIEHIAQVLDPTTRRIGVRAIVDNVPMRLRPEMFVRATVLRDKGVGVRVPNEALVTEGLYTYLYLQTSDQGYRRVRVEPIIKGGEFSYIGDAGSNAGGGGALKGGERVVTSGALLLAAEQHDASGK